MQRRTAEFCLLFLLADTTFRVGLAFTAYHLTITTHRWLITNGRWSALGIDLHLYQGCMTRRENREKQQRKYQSRTDPKPPKLPIHVLFPFSVDYRPYYLLPWKAI